MRLVLFDIDGTLLSSEGLGRASMQRALAEVFGSPGNPSYRYDGKTDKQIIRDVMRLEGHSDAHIDARMETLLVLYLEGLRAGVKSGRFNVRPSPESSRYWTSSRSATTWCSDCLPATSSRERE